MRENWHLLGTYRQVLGNRPQAFAVEGWVTVNDGVVSGRMTDKDTVHRRSIAAYVEELRRDFGDQDFLSAWHQYALDYPYTFVETHLPAESRLAGTFDGTTLTFTKTYESDVAMKYGPPGYETTEFYASSVVVYTGEVDARAHTFSGRYSFADDDSISGDTFTFRLLDD